jgi:hypothetical protein
MTQLILNIPFQQLRITEIRNLWCEVAKVLTRSVQLLLLMTVGITENKYDKQLLHVINHFKPLYLLYVIVIG